MSYQMLRQHILEPNGIASKVYQGVTISAVIMIYPMQCLYVNMQKYTSYTYSIRQISHNHSFAFDFRSLKRTDISKLPPLMIQQTFLPLNRVSFNTAAMTVADDGQTTIFILQRINCVAYMISSSETNIISSTPRFQCIILKVFSPKLVRKPSAILTGGICGSILWLISDYLASLARYGYTPMALHLFPQNNVDRMLPLASPPPPIGNTKQSKSFKSSKTSLAAVPCPTNIQQSSYGCMKWALYFFQTSFAFQFLSLRVLPDQITSPPQPITAFFLTSGEFCGITTYDFSPKTVEAYATACAWLPEEWVHTDLILGSNCSILLNAPLALNAPIFCRFSHLRYRLLQPAILVIVVELRRGVRCIYLAILKWASSINCLLIISNYLLIYNLDPLFIDYCNCIILLNSNRMVVIQNEI